MDKKEPLKKGGIHYYLLNTLCPKYVKRCQMTLEQHHLQAKCGGDVYVGEYARLFCFKCENEIPIAHAEFRCPQHSNTGQANVVFHEHPFNHWNIIDVMGPLVH